MTARPVVAIYLVHVEVPIELSPTERKRRGRDDRPPTVTLELDSRGGRVWDNVHYGLCGASFEFVPSGRDPRLGPEVKLIDLPYFDQVFRLLAEHHATNRTNPLGAFLRTAVDAMEAALAERDGSSVYFAEAGGLVKIGWSKRVAARITELQTGNASPIRLLGTTSGGRALERRLHDQFAGLRRGGEWFEATPELLAHIASICQGIRKGADTHTGGPT